MSVLRNNAIRHLCSLDHHDDPETIAAWAGDTAATKFTLLLQDPSVLLVVATMDDTVVGLAASCRDRVTLNYVDPRHRFCGISKALMAYVEEQMATGGVEVARLFSTQTAHRFYQAIGWHNDGAATPEQGIPMTKSLRLSLA